ncbi:hypothetical protein [Pectobacterium versatile]|uniref:hypothetical protein n=1 Tax=Pectobacterium versatile TaxID=2488639 RepID=UPI001F46A245|nr:hypothetical protein [Pectobacterium versatile]
MRGLSIRIDFAKAKVMRVIDNEKYLDDLGSVIFDAEDEGYIDGRMGVDTPPTMFADEPPLLLAWNKGYESGLCSIEMETCSYCNDIYCDMCPIHD